MDILASEIGPEAACRLLTGIVVGREAGVTKDTGNYTEQNT